MNKILVNRVLALAISLPLMAVATRADTPASPRHEMVIKANSISTIVPEKSAALSARYHADKVKLADGNLMLVGNAILRLDVTRKDLSFSSEKMTAVITKPGLPHAQSAFNLSGKCIIRIDGSGKKAVQVDAKNISAAKPKSNTPDSITLHGKATISVTGSDKKVMQITTENAVVTVIKENH